MVWYENGYAMLSNGVKRSVVICTIYHGPKPPDKDVCAHKNDIKDDDRSENLYWATYAENLADSIRNGRVFNQPGDLHPATKVSEADRLDILDRHYDGEKSRDLAVEYGVSKRRINAIIAEGKVKERNP